jgi:hypothetical protein
LLVDQESINRRAEKKVNNRKAALSTSKQKDSLKIVRFFGIFAHLIYA